MNIPILIAAAVGLSSLGVSAGWWMAHRFGGPRCKTCSLMSVVIRDTDGAWFCRGCWDMWTKMASDTKRFQESLCVMKAVDA